MAQSENTTTYSYHIFLLPFKWDFPIDSASIFTQKNSLNNIKFKEFIHDDWEDFYIDQKKLTSNQYNEFVYFHEFAREALFDFGKAPNTNSCLKQFSFKLTENSTYSIDTTKVNYKLSIEDITLNFYETGVGVLAFHLCNTQKKDLQSVLNINDFGRRIYPQYLDKDLGCGGANDSFFAKAVRLNFKESNPISSEYEKKDLKASDDFFQKLLPKHISHFFKSGIKITPLIDDRMHVISFIDNADFINDLKYNNGGKEDYGFIKSQEWNKYIFVDNNFPGLANESLLKQLNESCTYDRWVDYGTLYGVSRYSFVSTSTWDLMLTHTQNMYFQMVQLSLANRASILRFSDEIVKISALPNNAPEQKLIRIRNLYESYIKFINKQYFREVTAQEQGIELYNMIQEKMGIEKHATELKQDMQELFNFASFLQSTNQSIRLDTITEVGAWLIPVGVVTSIMGLATFPDFGVASCLKTHFEFLESVTYLSFWLTLFVLLIVTVFGFFFYKKIAYCKLKVWNE